jgi:hypothetical protein
MPIKNLILRLVKGSPLTATENDGNFTSISNAFNGLESRISLLQNDVVSASAPSDTTRVWSRLGSDGEIEGRYRYVNGKWIRPYRVPSTSGESIIWRKDAASIDTYDGGSAAAVTDTTGPFWEIDTEMSARMPLGVGTLPSSTSVTLGGTGGEEKTTLTVAQIPAHTHDVPGKKTFNVSLDDVPMTVMASAWAGLAALDGSTPASTGGSESHNNMPPYTGRYFLKRTARKFVVAT